MHIVFILTLHLNAHSIAHVIVIAKHPVYEL